MQALLVEDSKAVSESIRIMLESDGFTVDIVALGEDGVTTGRTGDYDVIVLDLMLPDIDGYEVLRRLRDARVDTPVLILSGLQETENKVKSLEYGADDYLTKPFNKNEFIARVNALTRRSKNQTQPLLETGRLTVNLDTGTFLMMHQ
jgi:two-component system cell cycle response regulator CtrA